MFLSNRSQTESAVGHLFLPQDLRWKPSGFAVQSLNELSQRQTVSPFILGHPKGWHPAPETSSWTSSLRACALASPCLEPVFDWFWAGAGLVINGQDAAVKCPAWSVYSHPSFVTGRARFLLELLGSLCTNTVETRHQSMLSMLAFAHGHIPGWPEVEGVEDKFTLHRLVPASSSLSLATDQAFKYASDWFCVGMCGLLDWKHSLSGFLVFT